LQDFLYFKVMKNQLIFSLLLLFQRHPLFLLATTDFVFGYIILLAKNKGWNSLKLNFQSFLLFGLVFISKIASKDLVLILVNICPDMIMRKFDKINCWKISKSKGQSKVQIYLLITSNKKPQRKDHFRVAFCCWKENIF
jgi:hypothetical protein